MGIYSNTSGRLRVDRTYILLKISFNFLNKEWNLSLADKTEELTTHLEYHGSVRFSIKIKETESFWPTADLLYSVYTIFSSCRDIICASVQHRQNASRFAELHTNSRFVVYTLLGIG